MAEIKFSPRAKETTATTGSGTYTLDGAVEGFQGIYESGIGSPDQTWYCCTDGIDWEIGVGTPLDDGEVTLSRDIIVNSSNSMSAVSWNAGDKDIFCVFPYKLLAGISGDWSSFEFDNDIVYEEAVNYKNIVIGSGNIVAGQMNVVLGHQNVIDSAGTASNTVLLGTAAFSNKGSGIVIGTNSTVEYFGDCQAVIKTVGVKTTNATETGIGRFELHGSASDTGTALYEVSVVARQTAGSSGTVGDSKAWKLDFVVAFDAGVLTQIGSTTTTVIGASNGASAWACVIDTTDNETGPIRVTGETNKTIIWTVFIRALENSNGNEEAPEG